QAEDGIRDFHVTGVQTCALPIYMVDMGGIPQRLVERVGEAQRHQVLHRLLAEIVVDAEDLAFAEIPADKIVEFARRIEIPPERLFQHDARGGRDEVVRLQVARDVAEQGGRNRQIEGADAGAVADRRLQLLETVTAHGVGRYVGDAGKELVQLRL